MSGVQAAAEATVSAAGVPFFAVSNLSRRFGPLVAVNGLSFELRRGEIFGIAGPNGAGKSTLLNLCSGFLAPNAGTILFQGERIEGLAPYRICHRGLARTFQVPQVFGSLSIAANVEIGAVFGSPRRGGRAGRSRELVEQALEMTGLAARRTQLAGTTDLLTRKMAMLAACLATEPRIVLMDEPLAGLNPEETERLVELIEDLHRRTEATFVLVEHKVRALARLSSRLMVLHFGRCICLDRPERVVRDPQVVEVYLGTAFVA